jgi:hypothetical protein
MNRVFVRCSSWGSENNSGGSTRITHTKQGGTHYGPDAGGGAFETGRFNVAFSFLMSFCTIYCGGSAGVLWDKLNNESLFVLLQTLDKIGVAFAGDWRTSI